MFFLIKFDQKCKHKSKNAMCLMGYTCNCGRVFHYGSYSMGIVRVGSEHKHVPHSY